MSSILKVTDIQDPTNSNSALTIDSSGQVTLPKIPFAIVNLSADTSVTPGPSATVPFNNVLSSRGISWNTSTYKFTVPGIYAYWCSPHKTLGMIGFVVVGNDKSNLSEIKKVKFAGKSKKVAKQLIKELEK